MSILFLTNSLLTTIQDFGRSGFRSFGVNPNGAMDNKAVRLINILLGKVREPKLDPSYLDRKTVSYLLNFLPNLLLNLALPEEAPYER